MDRLPLASDPHILGIFQDAKANNTIAIRVGNNAEND
jgi:hypothetical protein